MAGDWQDGLSQQMKGTIDIAGEIAAGGDVSAAILKFSIRCRCRSWDF